MSLYQSIRPSKLDDLVGNVATIGALSSMLRKPSELRPHTILLKGPSGCGKTTIARILAVEFGSSQLGTYEINAADTRGIDEARKISSGAKFSSFGGVSKTYIINEAHKLTKDAIDELLEIWEDTPSHCYFVLTTTDPSVIPPVVKTRCAEYEVNLLSRKEIVQILERACRVKGLEVSATLLEAISFTCEGSPRAALVSLEQVLDIENEDEALELLVSGTERDSTILDLLKFLIMYPEERRKKWKRGIEIVTSISEDSERVRAAILTFLFNKLKKCKDEKEVKDLGHLLEIFSTNTYYGGKSQLAGLVIKACFGET